MQRNKQLAPRALLNSLSPILTIRILKHTK